MRNPNQNPPCDPGVPQMAKWACLGSKCSQVRILLPGPTPFWILDFGFGIGRTTPVSSEHSFNQIPQATRTRGQTGKGAGLRNRILKVRILPRVPATFWILDFGFWIEHPFEGFCLRKRGVESRIQNPKSKIQNGKAGIAKRIKAAVCKTVNHRFESDYPLQTSQMANAKATT